MTPSFSKTLIRVIMKVTNILRLTYINGVPWMMLVVNMSLSAYCLLLFWRVSSFCYYWLHYFIYRGLSELIKRYIYTCWKPFGDLWKYLLFRLYNNAFVAFHHIHSCFYENTSKWKKDIFYLLDLVKEPKGVITSSNSSLLLCNQKINCSLKYYEQV